MLLLLAASSRRLDIAYTHGCCHLVNFPWNCAPKFGQNSIFERRMLLLHHQMPLLNAQLEENKIKKERKETSARHIQAATLHWKKNHVRPSLKKSSAELQMRTLGSFRNIYVTVIWHWVSIWKLYLVNTFQMFEIRFQVKLKKMFKNSSELCVQILL